MRIISRKQITVRRDISLRSPADIATLCIDMEYWQCVLSRHEDKRLSKVFRAMAYGYTAKELGITEAAYERLQEKVERILAEER